MTYVQRINSHKKQYASAGTEKASHLGASTGFEICEVTSDFATLTEHLRKNRYQLVLLEATPDYPVLNLLQTIRQEKLCQAIAMVGQTAEFKIVRKCFLLGVDDYLITPFEISQFISLFGKIEHTEHGKIEAENSQKNPCTVLIQWKKWNFPRNVSKN